MKTDRIMTRPPTSPGEVLKEEFLRPAGLAQGDLARHIGCDVKTVNRVVNGHHRVSADMALRLAAALGTTPEFWLNLQEAVDLYEARQRMGDQLPAPLDLVG